MIGEALGIGHDPGQHAAYVKSWVQILKDDPKEILRASRDADKITGYVMDLEKGRAPARIETLAQIERPSAPEVAQKALAEARQALRSRAGSGRER
jgi:antirestriction protein ArdC